MKRLLLVFAAVGTAVLLCLTAVSFWLGIKAEASYYNTLQDFYGNQGLAIAAESYDRGVFSSSARTRVALAGSSAQENGTHREVVLTHDIHHWPFAGGTMTPVMAVIETGIELTAQQEAQLQEFMGSDFSLPGIRQTTLLRLDGSGNVDCTIEPMQYSSPEDPDGASLLWRGLSASGRFSSNAGHLLGSMSAPQLLFQARDRHFGLSGLSSTADLTRIRPELYLGTVAMSLSELTFSDPADMTGISLSGLSGSSNSTLEDGLVRMDISFAMQHLEVNGSSYGPVILEQTARNLDPDALAAMQRLSRQMQQSRFNDAPDTMRQTLLLRYLEILPVFLAPSPEIRMSRISFQGPSGAFNGHALIRFDASKPYALDQPLSLLGALVVDLDVTISDGLLRQWLQATQRTQRTLPDGRDDSVQKQLAFLIEQRYLLPEGTAYTSRLVLKDGRLRINEREIPLGNLLFGVPPHS